MGPNPFHSGSKVKRSSHHSHQALQPPQLPLPQELFSHQRPSQSLVVKGRGAWPSSASLASVLAWFPSARPSVPTGLFFQLNPKCPKHCFLQINQDGQSFPIDLNFPNPCFFPHASKMSKILFSKCTQSVESLIFISQMEKNKALDILDSFGKKAWTSWTHLEKRPWASWISFEKQDLGHLDSLGKTRLWTSLIPSKILAVLDPFWKNRTLDILDSYDSKALASSFAAFSSCFLAFFFLSALVPSLWYQHAGQYQTT